MIKLYKNLIQYHKLYLHDFTNTIYVIVDILGVERCYACGGECKPDIFHPKIWHCENGHAVEIPCTDWLILFTIREKREIKIKKNTPSGKTSVGRGSWTPESESDTNLKFNEQLLRFDYLHELDGCEIYGIYLTDLIDAVVGN
jgi:hypothetical protein